MIGLKQNFEEDDIKNAMYKSFLKAWRRDYLKAGRDVEDDSIADIVNYMNLCRQELDDKHAVDNRNNKTKNRNRNTDRNNNRERGSRGYDDRGRGCFQSQNFAKEMNMECRVHGGHKWGDCTLNPLSPNYIQEIFQHTRIVIIFSLEVKE